jgi:hypothetical protein
MTKFAMLKGLFALAALAAAFTASPAIAAGQSAASAAVPADPAARCQGLFDALKGLSGQSVSFEKAEALGDSGCRYVNLRVNYSTYVFWMVDTLTLDRVDFPSAYAGRPPNTLSARADGIRLAANKPLFIYQARLIQKPTEMTLDYDLDTASHVLTLKDFTWQGERIGRLSLTAQIGGVDPDHMSQTMGSVDEGIRLRGASLFLDNHGMIEGYALMPALGVLPDGMEHPEQAVEKAKADAMAKVALLAAVGVPAASVTALLGFIKDLPQPARPLSITVAPLEPIPLSAVAGKALDDDTARAALVKSLNLTVTYH